MSIATPKSYVVAAVLASMVLYWVLDLSSSGRTIVDYAVIGLVGLAILWNLANLARRLYRLRGARALWTLHATVGLWLVGIFNTFLLRPELVGTWRNWAGWISAAIAALGTLALFFQEKGTRPRNRGPE
jgi:hypothetical protein